MLSSSHHNDLPTDESSHVQFMSNSSTYSGFNPYEKIIRSMARLQYTCHWGTHWKTVTVNTSLLSGIYCEPVHEFGFHIRVGFSQKHKVVSLNWMSIKVGVLIEERNTTFIHANTWRLSLKAMDGRMIWDFIWDFYTTWQTETPWNFFIWFIYAAWTRRSFLFPFFENFVYSLVNMLLFCIRRYEIL